MKNRVPPQSQRGMIMLLALMILAGILAVSISLASRTLGSGKHVRRDYQDEKVFQVADGGANVAESWLRYKLFWNPNPPQAELDAAPEPIVAGYNFKEYSIFKEARQDDVVISRGPYSGLLAAIMPFTIRSRAENATSSHEQGVEVKLDEFWINLFQYAIFYDGDLEISMRNPSEFTGRIHSNSNIYLTAQSNFDVVSGAVTAAGHIYNTPKDPDVPYIADKCRIADKLGLLHYLSYDWRDPQWVPKSLGDWDGLVQDSSHGVSVMPAPIMKLPNPIDLIKHGQVGDDTLHQKLRFWYRAGLRIVDGVGYDSLGNFVPIPASLFTPQSVMDWREGHPMAMRTIRIDSLIADGLVPENGMIYISFTHSNAAVRIKGGARLPLGGLTIASDNPVYVQGNYNTIDKQPASFFCDAFNMYSNAWLDSRADNNLNQRSADPTVLNACIVAGDVPTTPGHYSGGASNLIRLHERWQANRELTYRGSMVCVYASEQATGLFVDGPPVFSEWHRNQGYDKDLLDPDFWPDYAMVQCNMSRSSWRTR